MKGTRNIYQIAILFTMRREKLPLKFYCGEMKDYHTYEYLSTLESDEMRKKKLLGLAYMEKKHAEFWKEYLKKRGLEVKEIKFGAMRKFLIRFVRKMLGLGVISSLSEIGESSAISFYYDFYKNGDLDEEEREKLRGVILDEIEHEKFFMGEKKKIHAENIRDMVLGMNDGLVEILGAVTGLSAVYFSKPILVGLSGLVVGVAGALSMGIGAYVSVRSQRQVNEGIRKRLKIIFSISKSRLRNEIKDRITELGIPPDTAIRITDEMVEDENVIDKLIPVEENNERRAAIYTGLAYIIGVFFPVLPYFFSPNTLLALPLSIIFAGIALSIVSAIISVISGISVRRKVVEMVILGLSAAAISYVFGTAIHILSGGVI